MEKVLITGGFGWLDIGDEAMPRTFIDQLREQTPTLDICLISPQPKESFDYHGERSIQCIAYYLSSRIRIPLLGIFLPKSVSRFIREALLLISVKLPILRQLLPVYVQQLLEEFLTCTVLINVGGGNINSLIPGELLIKTFYWKLAGVSGKPVVVSGQNMGPFRKKWHKKRVLKAMKYVSIMTFRDRDVSIKRLGRGVPPGLLIFDAGDDAYNLKAVSRDRALQILEGEFSSVLFEKKYLVGFNLKASLALFGANKETLVEMGRKCATLLDSIIEKYECNILMIPTDYTCGSDDREVHRLIVNNMLHKDRAFPMEKVLGDRELKSICSLCDLVVASRYHCCIFTASSGVPFLGYANGSYQLTKLQGLCELLDMPNLFIAENFTEVPLGIFMKRIESIMNQLDKIKDNLKKKSFIISENTQILPNIVAKFIKKNFREIKDLDL
ncbi:MAG: polysaccharide pyruvyl transferase family protein [bacterium]|nr:polysaccharide pyruvyl transferase family protein [bacterium]